MDEGATNIETLPQRLESDGGFSDVTQSQIVVDISGDESFTNVDKSAGSSSHSPPVKLDNSGPTQTQLLSANGDDSPKSSSSPHPDQDKPETLNDRFEHTLAQFLNDAREEDDDGQKNLYHEDEAHPVTSVYDLLSDETRNYLRNHCNYSEDLYRLPRREHVHSHTARVETEQLRSDRQDKAVRISEPVELPPSADVLGNYMRTMQRYIGRSTFQDRNNASSVVSSHRSGKSVHSVSKQSSLINKYGYEDIENSGKTLDPSVRRWLISLRLPNVGKYLTLFDKNEIDKDSLKLMTESQLRKMGINSYGPLNKMLHSIRVMRNCDPPRLHPPKEMFDGDHDEKNVESRRPKSSREKVTPRKSKTRSSSAPNSARKAHNHPNDSQLPSSRSKSPSREKCLLRLLMKADEGACPVSARSVNSKSSAPPLSARSQMSEVELVKKAKMDIGIAAKKFQTKLEKDMQKKEDEERLDRMLREKRSKFASDYRRRQEAKKESLQRVEPSDDDQTTSRPKRTPRSVRGAVKSVNSARNVSPEKQRNKENITECLHSNVETQMAIDSTKPKLIFEDQLDDLELQIQNLIDVQSLKQSDSRSLLACIDHLQNQLHFIQSMVSKQRASVTGNRSDSGRYLKPCEDETSGADFMKSSPSKKPYSPRNESFQTELRFNERDFIGEGVFSQVFRGKHKRKEVAVKRLKVPLTTDDKSRLTQEVNTLMELRHENVCAIIGCITRMKFPLLILEFCSGGSLRQLLQRTEPLDHCAFYQIAEDVCSGLSYLHTGSSLSPHPHLRLTSHNVLLDSGLRARLSDVGLSRLRHECSRMIRETGASRVEWSQLPWMAPEVLANENAGPTADIYSFGVLLWEMLMRQVPYNGLTTYQMMERIRDGPPLTVPESCPVALHGLIRRCWQLRPSERTTVQEALVSLSRQKFPASWQTVLQSAGLSSHTMTNIAFCRRIIACLLNLSLPPLQQPRQTLPPNGPCGLLSFPIPDLELTPVSRIEELAFKARAVVEDDLHEDPSLIQSPLTAELSARGAVWAERRGGRLHDQ